PRLVPELARMRDRMELPGERPGEDVVGAEVARGGHVSFARRRAQEDQVLEDSAGGARLNARHRLASEPLTEVDDAVAAEGQNGLACCRVDLLQVVVHGKDQSAIFAVLAFPVV